MSAKLDAVSEVTKPKSMLGVRHLQAVMLFLAMLIAFSMRVNMSMAIVAMTDASNDNSFDWSVQTQSVILSSFFWGYVILQIPGGELAARFGSKILIVLCIGINSAASLLLPIGAHFGGWKLVCACRVVQGLSQGLLFPSVHNVIGKWVPLEEKSRLGTLVYSGGQLGTALQLIISGYIADYWGWPAIFYTMGSLGAVWTVLYMFIGSSTPKTSKIISVEEKAYIENSLGQVGVQKKLKTPWKSIFTSLPFLSLLITHCGHNWGFWTLMTEIPSYMNRVLGVDIKSNGVMSALPYLGMYLMSFPLGFTSDFVLKKKWLSITTSRKISNSISQYGPAIVLIILSYSPADVTVAVSLLTLTNCLNAFHYTGYLLVHIDMSPNFASTLMGITNCIANIVSLIAPLVAGVILEDETDPKEWRTVFFVASTIYVICNTIYVIFGSSEKQKWNEPRTEPNTNESDIKMEKAV
ncbi:putative inorganic phosphate cotransporter [Amyelois transitella]|uniref:putative inorganic phosphate cotransporter n=1 Tax=Amyelois transitella TaxID=680683 RepID=UPI0029905C5C|nr:putative inorganic phosphate cotransporter [Amyelois transitella]